MILICPQSHCDRMWQKVSLMWITHTYACVGQGPKLSCLYRYCYASIGIHHSTLFSSMRYCHRTGISGTRHPSKFFREDRKHGKEVKNRYYIRIPVWSLGEEALIKKKNSNDCIYPLPLEGIFFFNIDWPYAYIRAKPQNFLFTWSLSE